MPCTPRRTRSSRARTGWSGSARGSGPDRRTPASIPGRPGRGAGGFLADMVRRWNAMRGGSPAPGSPAPGSAPGHARRQPRDRRDGTAPVGPGGGLRRVRHRRRPGGAPAAPGLRADQLGCGLGCGDYLPERQQQRVPGHGGIEQQPDRLFARRCHSEQHIQQPGQHIQQPGQHIQQPGQHIQQPDQHIQQPDQRAGDRVPVEFFAVPVGRGQQQHEHQPGQQQHEHQPGQQQHEHQPGQQQHEHQPGQQQPSPARPRVDADRPATPT